MAESGRIEQIFEKMAEILTANELVKLAQLFLAKTSELMSATEESNEKGNIEKFQGSSRRRDFLKETKKATMLGNLINPARLDNGTSCANWILDSGASRHVTGASSEFASYNAYPSTHSEIIQTADGTCQPIKGVGSVKCSPSITLSSVLHVPSFPVNLLSLSALVDQMDCRVSFDRENCIIEDKKTGKEIGIGIRYGGLWFLD